MASEDIRVYVGECKFCGNAISLMTESQEEANEQATELCTCDRAKVYTRKKKIENAVEDICQDEERRGFKRIDTAVVDAITVLATMVETGAIEAVTITVEETKVTVKKNSDGLIIVKREKKNEKQHAI